MNIYEAALEKWGESTQIIIAIEEMAELTKALIKNIRNKQNNDEVLEELADVEIMLTQLKMIFGDITDFKYKKLQRLAKLV